MKLFSPKFKIERAKEHIAEIESRIKTFADRSPETFVEEFDADTGELLITQKPDQVFRYELATVVGDAIHNLRSTLDVAWCELLNTIAEWAVTDRSVFPVADTSDRVMAALQRGKIEAASRDLFNLIIRIEPYKGGKGDAIWSLHQLDIRDKHVLLLPLFDVTAAALMIEDDQETVSEFFTVRTRGREIVSRFPKGFKLKNKGNATFDILFDKGVTTYTKAILPTLRDFTVTVESTVDLLDALMPY